MHCLRIACQDKDKGADSVNELLQRFGMEGDVLFAGGFLFVPGFDPVFPELAYLYQREKKNERPQTEPRQHGDYGIALLAALKYPNYTHEQWDQGKE